MRVAIVQSIMGLNRDENLKKFEDFVRSASEDNARVVVFPEFWNAPYIKKYILELAEFGVEYRNFMGELAKKILHLYYWREYSIFRRW